MADEIIKAPDAKNDPEWSEIVEKLVEEMGDELPDKVIEVTELLISGWSTHLAAKHLRNIPKDNTCLVGEIPNHGTCCS